MSNHTLTVRTAKELSADLQAEVDRRSKRYRASKSGLTLLAGGYPYHIDRNRIDTPGKVLHWLMHLSDKTWFTVTDAQIVMSYANRFNGVDPYAENA